MLGTRTRKYKTDGEENDNKTHNGSNDSILKCRKVCLCGVNPLGLVELVRLRSTNEMIYHNRGGICICDVYRYHRP